MNFSRRDLLRTASAGAALTAISPGLKVAFAADTAVVKDTLIVLFLRFGSDGMQMIAPAGDPNYIANRPTIRVRTDGNTPGLGVGTMQNTDFFLHPATTDLKALFDQKKLAIVHAAGLRTTERSHFEVQERMELGANINEKQPSDGWLARHLKNLAGTRPALSTIALSSNNPESLLGFSNSLAISNTNNFAVSGGDPNANVIRALNAGKTRRASSYCKCARNQATRETGLLL